MKLEVGMFVRTDRGKIWLVTSTKAIDGHKHRIVDANYNILKLIQVGDYVNGGQVVEKTNEYIRINGGKSLWEYLEKEQDVKSIVTKEQFESMSYKVGELKWIYG